MTLKPYKRNPFGFAFYFDTLILPLITIGALWWMLMSLNPRKD